MMDSDSPGKRAVSAITRVPLAIWAAIRGALGRIFQVFFRNQLGDLNRQTERLGEASVEAAAYLSLELQALDRRLSRIENEIETLRDAVTSGEHQR